MEGWGGQETVVSAEHFPVGTQPPVVAAGGECVCSLAPFSPLLSFHVARAHRGQLCPQCTGLWLVLQEGLRLQELTAEA